MMLQRCYIAFKVKYDIKNIKYNSNVYIQYRVLYLIHMVVKHSKREREMTLSITYFTNETKYFEPFLETIELKGYSEKAILNKFYKKYKDCQILEYRRIK